MSNNTRGRTTTSVECTPPYDGGSDPTPGLVLIYSRLHAQLPSAVPFAVPVVTLGRESDNALSIPEAAVSRYHARFERRADGRTHILDNKSTNGTFVNGVRVEQAPLGDHDVVRIGDTLWRFVGEGIYGYGAYRIDGSVVHQVRPFTHGVQHSPLVGGYQIDAVLDRIARVAQSTISVIVTGDSGTGKEVVAREIHRLSSRRGAFQAINCAALPESLIESELFGYRKGAFSGATTDKMGLVQAANRGTLFLDEIGDMPLEAQAKLLRVLQEREVLPIGATSVERVDVRVVCATHRNLEDLVERGRFRGDLLARLRELSVRLPQLAERREDLYPLVRHFLDEHEASGVEVSFPFMLALAHYHWPFNVRELASAVRVAVTLARGKALDVQNLPETVRDALTRAGPGRSSVAPTARSNATTIKRSQTPSAPGESRDAPDPVPSQAELRDLLAKHSGNIAAVSRDLGRERAKGQATALPRGEQPTEAELRDLLAKHSGNIAAVGRELGRERMQVHRWLRRYGIEIDEYRP